MADGLMLADMHVPHPAFVTAELAEMAMGCEAMTRARKLAGWVGSGKSLTARGVLRPADAGHACQLLGIRLSGQRLRSAFDCDELMAGWTAAVDAGLVTISGRRAIADGVPAGEADHGLVLTGWLRAAVRALGLPGEPCAGCLTVLNELAGADGPLTSDHLAAAVAEALGEDEAYEVEAEPCPSCGEIHLADDLGLGDLLGDDFFADEDPADEESADRHAAASIAHLIAFGAAGQAGDGGLRLTPLGDMLATSIFQGAAPPATASAGELIASICEVPPPVARTLARPWLSARSDRTAADALLAFAETAAGESRLAALAFCADLGPGTAGAWRDWADRPGFGAYARRWLAAQGEPIARDPRDDAWLAADALGILLADVPVGIPPALLAAALREQFGDESGEALQMLRDSGHPDAARIVAAFGGVRSAPTPLSLVTGGSARSRSDKPARHDRDGSVLQVKVSLRGVSKPPVWRRVAVPAEVGLDDLHEVIISVMGWSGGHLHSFDDGWQEYGSPDPELGHADESAVSLSDLLAVPGDKIRYTYDFGDGWEHDIVLEKVLAASGFPTLADGDPGVPVCLAGKGACPPEDCGGPWGYADLKGTLANPADDEHQDMLSWLGLESAAEFDPANFSVDEANARLRYRAGHPSPDPF
jgi:hypothetical protein